MGNCCKGRTAQQFDFLEFSQKVTLKVMERDRRGNFKGYSLIKLEVPAPTDQYNNIFTIYGNTYRASGCVLSGKDPRGECKKECQDTYAFTTKNNIFLAILFDGHGKQGRKVSIFCRDYILSYFDQNHQKFEKNPKKAIENAVQSCDIELKRSEIECSLSGTTAVVVVINYLGIHVGSLGDSRAVLASVPKENTSIPLGSDSGPYKHSVNPSRLLNAIALTVDQKPNHDQELRRIRDSGGIVERVTNDLGQPIGPYRIWKRKGNFPGLAMSRSIGDKIAHEIGVISLPIVNSFKILLPYDKFIIIASDGLWDSMDNFEAINLVEKFRNSCQASGANYPAKISNSSISRLLCEEARYRWYGIVEEEDVMIDDISCIVIEFNSIQHEMITDSFTICDRNLNKFSSIIVETQFNIDDTVPARNDPTRGSIVEPVVLLG